MLAKKKVSGDRRPVIRDKEAKIDSIVQATRDLIVSRGYDKVTIRDIAEKADVSIGLIYKYFPEGKFDILIKGFGVQNIDGLMMVSLQDDIDYDDFPGYIRNLIVHWQEMMDTNKSLIKALTIAALTEGEISGEMEKVDIKDYQAIGEVFTRFKDVDMGDKDPMKLLVYWAMTIKGILLLDLIYPVPFADKTALTDLLVDLSLNIWGYKPGDGK
jgi:AcrR family transcriptional regulator